ncbi:MAG: hypothetical protein NVS9B3_08540 [Gemmatimonadaceae bacterium]
MRRAFAAALTERLPFKAAALFLAAILWAVVRTRETTEALVPVRIAPVLDSTVSVRGRVPAVRAVVAARAADIAALYASPPVIRRVVHEEAGDSVRFDLTPVDVDLEGVPGRVLDIRPRTVTLRLHHAPVPTQPPAHR